MKHLILIFAVVSLCGQSTITIRRSYGTGAGAGVLVVTKDGIKVAEVAPGFSYFNGGGDGRAQLMSSHCSANHAISEEPSTDALGRYVLRMRPNPALLAVYRGGVRLEPGIHYRLVYLDAGQLPDRFELTAAAPPAGKVIVDYTIGTAPIN